jgi:hypothetical protein
MRDVIADFSRDADIWGVILYRSSEQPSLYVLSDLIHRSIPT